MSNLKKCSVEKVKQYKLRHMRFKNYIIWTVILTIITISLNIWGMLQESTTLTKDIETRWVVLTGLISAITVFRWLRIKFDDDLR